MKIYITFKKLCRIWKLFSVYSFEKAQQFVIETLDKPLGVIQIGLQSKENIQYDNVFRR